MSYSPWGRKESDLTELSGTRCVDSRAVTKVAQSAAVDSGEEGGRKEELSVFSAQLGYELKSPLKISLAIKNKHTHAHAKDKH